MTEVLVFLFFSVAATFVLGLGMRRVSIRGLQEELELSRQRRRESFALGRLSDVRRQDKQLARLGEELEQLGANDVPLVQTVRH